MQWINEPAHWSLADGVVTMTADGGTDFWRTTLYGYVRDSGHLYGELVDGDFDLTMLVHGDYADQYDQAGAMVRIDEQHWLKTGVEFVDGRIRLSTVITLAYSSWTVADLPAGAIDLRLQLARRGDAVEIRFGVDGNASDLAGVVYLPPGKAAFAGAMCAAPVGDGFEVSFHDLAITTVGELEP
jgi:regulation of enolase protein 1 (concanavalin A-like superfamily)